MRNYTSFLSSDINAYITYQKASDRMNDTWECRLFQFDKFCKANYPQATGLTQEMVDTWCRQRKTEKNNSCISRTGVIVSFIRYLRKRGLTEVAEPDLPKHERSTYIPHSFTEAELQNFFRACDEAKKSAEINVRVTRHLIIPVIFRLLYSSGIRTCEARMLRTKDVDLAHGILNIRFSKGTAQHYVALHESMLEIMRRYDAAISKHHSNRAYFFPNRGGSYYRKSWLGENFRRNWYKYNSARAVAYDFRHNYAIENINSWTNAGFGFDDKLLYLSKSMGHANVENTKYYYSLVPGLADTLQNLSVNDEVIPEVRHD
jgi:integrase